MKKKFLELHWQVRIPILILFFIDIYLNSDTKLMYFIGYCLIVTILIFPYLDFFLVSRFKKKQSKKYQVKNIKYLILNTLIWAILLYLAIKVKTLGIIWKLLLVIYSFLYLIMDKKSLINYSAIYLFTNEKYNFNRIVECIYIVFRVTLTYIFRVSLVWGLFSILFFKYPEESFHVMLNAITVTFSIFQIAFWGINLMQLLLGMKKVTFETAFVMLIVLGMLDPKWWGGISILFSLTGLTLSSEFSNKYLNEKLQHIDAIFLKTIIPYISFIVYVSLTTSHDLLTPEKTNWILNVFNSQSQNSINNDLLFSYLMNGFLEVFIFGCIWKILEALFKVSKIFNDDFIEQYISFDKLIRKKAGSLMKSKSE